MKRFLHFAVIAALICLPATLVFQQAALGQTTTHKPRKAHHAAVHHAVATKHVAAHRTVHSSSHKATVTRVTYVRMRNGHLRRTVLVRHRSYEHFTGDSFAETDLTAADSIAGEDPVVRQAALEALGNMNGTVVAIEAGPFEWR
jgi:penicillin-binding protein 2